MRAFLPRDGHALDQDRAASATAARKHIAADGSDAFEDVAQVAGDGDFLDRELDLAAFHPVAGRAARVIARHEVDALAEELGDEKPTPHPAQHALEIRPV